MRRRVSGRTLTVASHLQHSQFSSQHNVARSPLSGFGSTPHLPRDLRDQREMWDQRDLRDQRDVRDQYYPAQYRDMDEYSRQQFYLHDSPPPPQRRTWAQHAQHQHEQEHRGWQVRTPRTRSTLTQYNTDFIKVIYHPQYNEKYTSRFLFLIADTFL